MKERAVQDVSALPTWGFGARSTPWWGTLGFIAIEGGGFALCIGAYLYLITGNPNPPPITPPPYLWPATALTLLLIASVAPNIWLNRIAHLQDLRAVQVGLVVMSAVGLFALALRGVEIAKLEIRWDTTAFGSMIWFLIGLHTTHLATDVGDTIVLTALMFTRHAQPRRFSDVSDNAFYWYFVVGAWIPIYVLVYWLPRW